MSDDPMDTPPADHGSDRYDYIEIIGAPPNTKPSGRWFDKLVEEACPDCRANLFIYWRPSNEATWAVEIAHDDGCPTLAKHEMEHQ